MRAKCSPVKARPMYAIQATMTVREKNQFGGWTETRQLPTFYLDPNVQGIISEEHAADIARGMFQLMNATAEYHITAVKVS